MTESPPTSDWTKSLKQFGIAATAIAAIIGLVFLVRPSLRPGWSPPKKAGEINSVEIIYGNPTQFIVKARIEGFNRQVCHLNYSIYDAATGNGIQGFADLPGTGLTPEGDDDQASLTFAIRVPPRPGNYLSRVKLVDPDGVELAARNGPRFSIRA
jgi:hypothetical protein